MSGRYCIGFLLLGVLSGVLCLESGDQQGNVNKTVRSLGFGDLRGCIQLKSMTCFLDVSENIVNREKRSILGKL